MVGVRFSAITLPQRWPS